MAMMMIKNRRLTHQSEFIQVLVMSKHWGRELRHGAWRKAGAGDDDDNDGGGGGGDDDNDNDGGGDDDDQGSQDAASNEFKEDSGGMSTWALWYVSVKYK